MGNAKTARDIQAAYDRQCAQDVEDHYGVVPEFDVGDEVETHDGQAGKIVCHFAEWDDDDGVQIPMVEIETFGACGLGWYKAGENITVAYWEVL